MLLFVLTMCGDTTKHKGDGGGGMGGRGVGKDRPSRNQEDIDAGDGVM